MDAIALGRTGWRGRFWLGWSAKVNRGAIYQVRVEAGPIALADMIDEQKYQK